MECKLAQLPKQVQELRRYQHRCILCAQLVKVSGHMKIHWQTTHKEAWGLISQDAESAARSLRAAFNRPCQFCDSNAKHGTTDATHHATKCTPLFQVLAARKLRGLGKLESYMHMKRGPAMKQREQEPQYKRLERQGILAMLCGTRKEATPETMGHKEAGSSSSSALQQTTNVPAVVQVFSGGEHGHRQPVPGVRQDERIPGGPLHAHLRNPHNLCYANASILAMLHTLQDGELPRGLRPLRDAVQHCGGVELNLATHFGLRSLFRGWPLDNRQRDAAEFIDFILGKVGYEHPIWEARVLGGGIHSVVDAGSGMLYLDLPSVDCAVQELISAWHFQAQTHALIAAPEHLIVQLGRFPHRGKSKIQVRFQQQVGVPVFTDGIDCAWKSFQIVAGTIHYGDSPHSGHYRSVLRVQDDWWETEDSVSAMPSTVTEGMRRGLYTVWLKRDSAPARTA